MGVGWGGVEGWEGESLGICLINRASLCVFLRFCKQLTQPQKGSLIPVMLRAGSSMEGKPEAVVEAHGKGFSMRFRKMLPTHCLRLCVREGLCVQAW